MAVLVGLVLVLVIAITPTARAADFGYTGVLGCLDTPTEDPRTLNDAISVAVPQSGSPVYVGAGTPTGAAAPNRVLAYDSGGRQLWSIDHAASGVLGDPHIGLSSDGFYVGDNYRGFNVGRVTRFVANAGGASEAASWEVTGEVLSVVGSKTTDGVEFVAVLTRTPPGGVYFFDTSGNSLGGLGFADNDPNFFLGIPKAVSSGGGRLIFADNASKDGFNITSGRLTSYGLTYKDGQIVVTSVYHVDVPFHTAGIWGANNGIWLMGGDDAGTFAHYSNTLQPIDTFTRSNSTPGRTTQVPFTAIAADGLGNVYLADSDRVLRLGPGGSLPSSGTMIGQCESAAAPTTTNRLAIMTPGQNILKKHGVVVNVNCATPCTSVARATITILGPGSRKIVLKPDTETDAQTHTQLHPRLSRRQLRHLRNVLTAGIPAKLKLTVTAVDSGGVVRRRVITATLA